MFKTKLSLYCVAAGLAVLSITCTEKIVDNLIANVPPDTFIFLYPDEDGTISQQKSRLTVHWWGDDPDGLVLGYFFKWDGLDSSWTFTTKNDSTFSLPIGTVDTNYTFLAAAADNQGNGQYDQQVIWNNLNIGPEPFIDKNGDGVYNEGELYYDIGLIDPSPASQKYPIKNSAPLIEWSKASTIPLSSFPVITIEWDASDLDGDESIVKINLALNDTTDYISLEGFIRLVTLRISSQSGSSPEMDILINGSDQKIYSEKLRNLKLDDYNRIFIQAEDISGAKSLFLPLPDTSRNWFVKNPKGELLIVDDYEAGSGPETFYNNLFDNFNNGAIIGKYDILNLETASLPFPNVTYLETLKLFKFVYWYSKSAPSLDLTSLVTQKYIESGGKIAFSITFQDSSGNFNFELPLLQNFLPLDGLGQSKALPFLFAGGNILQSQTSSGYPDLKTASTIAFVRTFIPSPLSAAEIYDLSSSQINGNIALIDNSKSLFFIGLPLHQCDAVEGSVKQLIEKVFIEDFGFSQ